MTLTELLDTLPTFQNETIITAIIKAYSIINDRGYNSILCSISGGSDSDIVLDIIGRVDVKKKVKYVWFNTGLEYQATKKHLDYLERKYNVEIIRERAIKPIPLTCKQYGQPFISKFVSEQIYRLQKHGFNWVDEAYEELVKKYPKCVGAIKWWCNQYTKERGSEKVASFDIGYNKYLKEFLLANPPTFKISPKCCHYAKKGVGKQLNKKYNADLSIIGVRRAEGGIRATVYKNCYTPNTGDVDSYRPIFWFTNDDKKAYEEAFNIIHSDCYKKYGFVRTGCCCCPYGGKNLEEELKVTELVEPKLYKAVCNVFKDSYKYTKQYREFYAEMERKSERVEGQMYITDFLEVQNDTTRSDKTVY